MNCQHESASGHMAFSLIELLVSMAVVSILLVVLLSVTSQTGSVIQRTTGKIEQFREAREAFESVSRKIAQATLNTYWDYDDPSNPTRYTRQSELRFISGNMQSVAGAPPTGKDWPGHGIFFQAPLGFSDASSGGSQPDPRGLGNLLNTWGYFVEHGDDIAFRPSIVTGPGKVRFRLCEFMQPANDLTIYTYTSGTDSSGKPKNLTYSGNEWFTSGLNQSLATRPVHVLADNIIALIITPKLSSREDPTGAALAPTYSYDSTSSSSVAALNPKNQLPPVVQVTMVAMDESSANRLTEQEYTEIRAKVSGLFQDSSKYKDDLELDGNGATESLEATLARLRVNYQVFTANVIIKGAKWSREQIN